MGERTFFFPKCPGTQSESLGQLTTMRVAKVLQRRVNCLLFILRTLSWSLREPNSRQVTRRKPVFITSKCSMPSYPDRTPADTQHHSSTLSEARISHKVGHSKGLAPISNNKIEQLW